MPIQRMLAAACLALLAAIAPVAVIDAQSPDAQFRARATAFFEALASGSAEKLEAMARENYTPEHLARQTPERRKMQLDRLQSDAGRLTLVKLEVQAAGVALEVEGSTGFVAQIQVDMEPKPPHRIIGYLMKADRRGTGPPPPVNASMSAEDLAKGVDAYFAPLVTTEKFTGVVLIAKDGSPAVVKAYGIASREARLPVTPDTRFNLGSSNKIFTKIGIAQLIIDGKIALTDTIGKLLPDYPNEHARTASVSQLVNHGAGIADFFGPDFDSAPKTRFRSNADYYRFVSAKPLLFPPGTRFQYCNGCYIVLGAIIERISGVSYEQYVSEHVFKPAGMRGAGFFLSDRFPPNVAIGYTLTAPGSRDVLQPNTALFGVAGSAAGGAYATAADLLAFDNALREGRLLNAKQTAWVLDARADVVEGRRAAGPLSVSGGAQGMNAALESDGTWAVVVLANFDPPVAQQACVAIARQLRR